MKKSADPRFAPRPAEALDLDAARRSADAHGNHAIDEFLAGRLTRRELLRYASVIGMSLAGGGLLAPRSARAQAAAGANATTAAANAIINPRANLISGSSFVMPMTGPGGVPPDGQPVFHCVRCYACLRCPE